MPKFDNDKSILRIRDLIGIFTLVGAVVGVVRASLIVEARASVNEAKILANYQNLSRIESRIDRVEGKIDTIIGVRRN